jgi:hypothetical protein
MRLSYCLKGSWNRDTLKEKPSAPRTNLAALNLATPMDARGRNDYGFTSLNELGALDCEWPDLASANG